MPYGKVTKKKIYKKKMKRKEKTLIWGKKVVVFPSFLIHFLQLFKWKTNFMPTWVLLKHVLYKEYPMNIRVYTFLHYTHTHIRTRIYRVLLNTNVKQKKKKKK